MFKKSQLITMDFMVGSIIFLVLITISFVSLYTYPIRLNDEQNKNELLLNTLQVSDTLIKTPGVPGAWEKNSSSLRVIGLAESDRVLSKKKVDSFVNLDYNKTRQLFGFNDFYFKLSNNTGNITTYGKSFNGTNSISIRRYVFYEGSRAKMEITFWE